MFETLKITTLPNGVRIATCALPGFNSCSIGFNVEMGSRYEKASQAGWSHFLEHMAFKGSAKHPTARAISRPFERIGADYNAATGFERTNYHARVPASRTALAVGILGDMVCHPTIPSREINRERSVIMEEIKEGLDSPDSLVWRHARAALWPGHALGRPITGNPEALSRADADTLRAFHAECYTGRKTIVAAAGNLDHDRFVNLVRPYAESLPPGSPLDRSRPKLRPAKPFVAHRMETKQVHVSIVFRACGAEDFSKRDEESLLVTILGTGMNSRLFRSVRERNGLAYSIGASIHRNLGAGMFSVGASVDPARAAKALSLCGRELRKLATEPPSRTELSDAKENLSGSLSMFGETPGAQMNYIAGFLHEIGRVEPPETIIGRVRAVRLESVFETAKALLPPENATLSLVLPNDLKESPESLREAFLNG